MNHNLSIESGDEKKEMNPYEMVNIIAKRSRQIRNQRRADFSSDMEKLGLLEVNKDPLINTDGWQEALAQSYEEKEDPIVLAQRELAEDRLICTRLDLQDE